MTLRQYRIACPPGQDPAQFTGWVLRLAPGDYVQRDTSQLPYVLLVGERTYRAWRATLPPPPAPAPVVVADEAPASSDSPAVAAEVAAADDSTADADGGDETTDKAESAPAPRAAKSTKPAAKRTARKKGAS